MGDNFDAVPFFNTDSKLQDKSISVIGLGLIGGSIAKALRKKLGIKDITAVDCDTASLNQAVREGVVTRGFTELNAFVFNSDIIFLCTPVRHSIGYLKIISENARRDCIVTDVGSTKGQIIRYVDSMPDHPCFIGGHPMTGGEKMGYSASFAHIFENAYYILTPGKGADSKAMECMAQLVQGIGAIPIPLDADEHDRITGGISHLPHIIAYTLVNLIKEMDSHDGKMQMLAAGGFKDITRIASSSPEMWENIVLSNKDKVLEILREYLELLGRVRNYIESDDSINIYNFFQSSKNYRDSFSSTKKGLIDPVYNIIVDVEDKPGIIGEIATILGSNGINIKNINVSNSREYEQGCLTITLTDLQSVNSAFDLLVSRGYKVYK